MAKLTSRGLAEASAITLNTLIHIVTTGDTSQSPDGSSYKATLEQLTPIFSPYGYQNYSAVTITSVQMLSIGSTPIEILPAPGASKYYDFKVYFEYIFNTTPYTVTGQLQLIDNTTKRVTNLFDINGQLTDRALVSDINSQNQFLSINSNLELTTSNGSDPTLGDGTLKIKIFYNIVDFG